MTCVTNTLGLLGDPLGFLPFLSGGMSRLDNSGQDIKNRVTGCHQWASRHIPPRLLHACPTRQQLALRSCRAWSWNHDEHRMGTGCLVASSMDPSQELLLARWQTTAGRHPRRAAWLGVGALRRTPGVAWVPPPGTSESGGEGPHHVWSPRGIQEMMVLQPGWEGHLGENG